ncbi:hypothetical protein J2X11_000621 [Aeromicrobium panaciterrae]|uniref:Uncharacterized protein n=1 Tax=Aeromicrobium panaciterrae TaxID=363861 RepID=A0ABU1UKR9_9ACTN|nr:hypothetical protein [Aeromicrobium panaciterrae]MDR7085782.1 hypothetical protein [Aeromicrobium panaciterrae]
MFHQFFDDAAIFPPGNMPMKEAVRAHLARRGTPEGEYVGPFICSAPRLGELRDALGHGHLELSLVATVDEFNHAAHDLAAQQNLTLVALELNGEVDRLPEIPNGLRVFVERTWHESLRVPEGAMLKLRCGGPDTRDTPSACQLGGAIQHCVENDLAFKLTAGLHHAVRTERDHGFLNILAAVNAAIDGSDPVPALLESDAAALKVSNPEAVRRLFRSIGTCSIDEPVTDLRELELIA